jgi:hypothetical protein
MAFTVGGTSAANSYVGVAYADDYFADRGNVVWGAAITGAKQGALVRATDYIKSLFALRFDPDLFDATDPDNLPDELLRATCEYAVLELASPGSLAPPLARDESGYAVVLTKKKTGPIEKEFTVVNGTAGPSTRRSFPVADGLIAALLIYNATSASVIR